MIIYVYLLFSIMLLLLLFSLSLLIMTKTNTSIINVDHYDDPGAFLASAKDVNPEARGNILLHDTDLLLAHNKVAR